MKWSLGKGHRSQGRISVDESRGFGEDMVRLHSTVAGFWLRHGCP